jgi:F0F1-type ATP synthase assembly protein I
MPQDEQNWGKYLAFGIEVAVGVVLGVVVGQWIDHRWHTDPWGVLAGALLGLAGGMYPLVKEGLKANKD